MKTKTITTVCLAALCLTVIFAYAHRMESHVPFKPATVEELERFHGHLGPFVVLGAKMGEYAVTQHDMPRYFGVMVNVECSKEPPTSCLIDGLQYTAGATFGKKNITHTFKEHIRVTIQNVDTKLKVIYKLKPQTLDWLEKWAKENIPVEKRGLRMFDLSAEELFDIEVKKES